MVFHGGEHRADDRERQITGDEHAHQRGDEQVKHRRYDLVQAFFQEAHHPHRNDNRNDVALIADQRHFIQAEEHFLPGLHALACNRPCVLQVGVQHNHADHRAEERVAAEHLGRGERDQDGQEGIRHVGEQLREHVNRAQGIQLDKPVVNHEVQRLHDAHQEAGRHDRRDDRHEDVAQRLDRALEPVALGRALRLGLVLADRRRARSAINSSYTLLTVPVPKMIWSWPCASNTPCTPVAFSSSFLFTLPLSAMTRRRRVAQCAADTMLSLPPMFCSTSEAAFFIIHLLFPPFHIFYEIDFTFCLYYTAADHFCKSAILPKPFPPVLRTSANSLAQSLQYTQKSRPRFDTPDGSLYFPYFSQTDSPRCTAKPSMSCFLRSILCSMISSRSRAASSPLDW